MAAKPRARALMLQGTGSDVGKSTLVAGLCRVARRQGLTVRPFKAQNMSNNAAVTREGGEIGRAQALQARACGVAPSIHMNPVLLKPESDLGAQVVVQGQVRGRTSAADYQRLKATLLPAVLDSFARLSAEADLVIVEGAGSPAEINLRPHDIANMGFAQAAKVPVVLVGDIDRGGVIASLVGTHVVLAAEDRNAVVGFLINKFRGDVRLFDDGLRAIVDGTGWRSFGVLPWVAAAGRLPSEDAVTLQSARHLQGDRSLCVAVPLLSRIANFDDLDPLAAESNVEVVVVPPGQPIPAAARLVVLPGTKSTLADLAFLRAQGWDIDLRAHVRRGGYVLGLCGGYQMLGRSIADPEGVEGRPETVAGLGLLDVETVLGPHKALREASGVHLSTGEAVHGYEIHVGRTTGAGRPWLRLAPDRLDGAVDQSGRVAGTYLHGLFAADGFRRAFVAQLGVTADAGPGFEAGVEGALDELADQMERHLDVAGLLEMAR